MANDEWTFVDQACWEEGLDTDFGRLYWHKMNNTFKW